MNEKKVNQQNNNSMATTAETTSYRPKDQIVVYQKTKSSVRFSNDYNIITKTKKKHPLKLLFDVNNIKDIIKTCLKPRENRVRAQIWLLFVSMVIYLLSHLGPSQILFQFAQKVYHWESAKYSYASSLGNVFTCIAMTTVAPILVKVILDHLINSH